MKYMTPEGLICPICGARILKYTAPGDYVCSFCAFERRPALDRQTHTDQDTWDISLPFQADINGYFKRKFQQSAPGDLWHISTPVTRLYGKPAPLPGQINFFRAKNIMFLLEQHGFKMSWRENRFSLILKLIARKC